MEPLMATSSAEQWLVFAFNDGLTANAALILGRRGLGFLHRRHQREDYWHHWISNFAALAYFLVVRARFLTYPRLLAHFSNIHGCFPRVNDFSADSDVFTIGSCACTLLLRMRKFLALFLVCLRNGTLLWRICVLFWHLQAFSAHSCKFFMRFHICLRLLTVFK